MTKFVLYLLAVSILLTGCLPSTYQEGMTVIGIPDALPSGQEGRSTSSAKKHDQEERIHFNNWMEECQGRLGTEIPAQIYIGMHLPSFDLEEGWSATTPRLSLEVKENAPFTVTRFRDDLLRESGDRAIGVTAVLGRFQLQHGNTSALSRLSDYVDTWNKGQSDEDRLWFSRTSAEFWTSGLMALSLERVDEVSKARYSTFSHWLRETQEHEAVTWPRLFTLRLDELVSQEAVIGPRLVGASGRVTFTALAVTLERHGDPIGCLRVNII
ncbi:MAG: hypothetical protein ABIO72_05475 [Patescibacteria group bacterium]